MDKKSKKFFVILCISVLFSIIFSYYTFVIKKDFRIFTDKEAFNQSLLEE